MRSSSPCVLALALSFLGGGAEAQFNFGPRLTHLDVGRPGEWNDHDVTNPVVLESEVFTGSPYTMYYTGHGGPVGHVTEEYVVGVAHSPDGVSWTRSVTAALGWGAPGEWDSTGMIWHTVVEDPAASPARFRMYYAASDGASITAGPGPKTRIGVAFSHDGKTFTKHPANPILDVGPPGSWDAAAVFGCSVLAPHETGAPHWKMWFTGFSDGPAVPGATAGVGYALSGDGLIWTKHGTPLPTFVGSLGVAYFQQPVVRYLEGAYHMWITKKHDPHGLATSSIHWGTSADGVDAWEGPYRGEGMLRGVSQPSPLWDGPGSEVRLWMVKENGGGTHPRYGGLYDNIAMATSPIFRDHPAEPYLVSNGIHILGAPITITTIDSRAGSAPYAMLLDTVFNTTPASIPLPFGVLALHSPLGLLNARLDASGYHSILLPGFTDPLAIGLRVNLQSVIVETPLSSDAFSNPMTLHLVLSP